MLISFIITTFDLVPRKYGVITYPRMIFQWSKDIYSLSPPLPLKYGGAFFKKSFSWRIGEQNLFGRFMVACSALLLKCITQQPKHYKSEYFRKSWRHLHLKIKSLWKNLFLRLVVKKFQSSCHVQPDLYLLFGKSTVQIEI